MQNVNRPQWFKLSMIMKADIYTGISRVCSVVHVCAGLSFCYHPPQQLKNPVSSWRIEIMIGKRLLCDWVSG